MLSDIQITSIVGIVSAVLGAGVAVVSALITNRANARAAEIARVHQQAISRREITRTRGEELYTQLQRWLNSLFGYFLVKGSVMQGKLTYNQGLDLEINSKDPSKTEYVRIEMLIDVYFPDLRPLYDEIISHRDAANVICGHHKRKYAIGETDGREFLPQLLAEQRLLESHGVALKEALIKRIRDA